VTISPNLGSIKGGVITPLGEPVEGAILVITGDSPPHEDIAAITNNKGEYKFENLLPGIYRILINAENSKQYTQTLYVNAGKVASLDFILKDSKMDR